MLKKYLMKNIQTSNSIRHEINEKLQIINKRISKLEDQEISHYMTLRDMAALQQDHDSKIKELYAEWQKRKQEQKMTHLQQTHIDQHNIIGKRVEARLKFIDTENPYTVAHLAL